MIELIAEVSSNHGGSVPLAKEFIWHFAEAGATWIKFQHTRVRHLRRDDPQYGWFERAELTLDQFAELEAECRRAGVRFLTTVYHPADVPEVAQLGLDAIKVGSGEAKEPALCRAIRAAAFARVFVATGLWNGWQPWERHAEFLHCVTRYPCPAMAAHRDDGYIAPYVGWSDHCVGLEGAQLAILEGARVIEKHVCLPHQARPAKPFEATVEEFRALRAFADENPERFLGRWQVA